MVFPLLPGLELPGLGGANNARLTPADQMLAKVTRIAGVVFFVVAILACVFASRLA